MADKTREILVDMQGRLRVLEATAEVSCAQQRELITKLDSLAKHNRTLADHVLRLLRAKEALLEALGRLAITGLPDPVGGLEFARTWKIQDAPRPPDPPSDPLSQYYADSDLQRFLREMAH